MTRLLVATCLAALFCASAKANDRLAADSAECGGEIGSVSARAAYTGQRISFDFKDADVVNVLRMLAEIGGENIVVTDDVKGRITLRLVDVPWDQALDIVMEMNRLACVTLGNVRAVSTTEEMSSPSRSVHASEAR